MATNTRCGRLVLVRCVVAMQLWPSLFTIVVWARCMQEGRDMTVTVTMAPTRLGLRTVITVMVSSRDGRVSTTLTRCTTAGFSRCGKNLVNRFSRTFGTSDTIIDDRLTSSDRCDFRTKCDSRLWFSLLALSRNRSRLFLS